jgi:hypothetical protein
MDFTIVKYSIKTPTIVGSKHAKVGQKSDLQIKTKQEFVTSRIQSK